MKSAPNLFWVFIGLAIYAFACKPSTESEILDESTADQAPLGTPISLKLTYTAIDRLTPGVYELLLGNQQITSTNRDVTEWSIAEDSVQLSGDAAWDLLPTGKPLNLHLKFRLVQQASSKASACVTTNEVNPNTNPKISSESTQTANPDASISSRQCGGPKLNPDGIALIATRDVKINCDNLLSPVATDTNQDDQPLTETEGPSSGISSPSDPSTTRSESSRAASKTAESNTGKTTSRGPESPR